MAGHPECRIQAPHQPLAIIDEVRIQRAVLVQRLVDGLQGGRKMGDDHVHLAGQRRHVAGYAAELLHMQGRAPVTGQPKVGNVSFVMIVHRVAPEV